MQALRYRFGVKVPSFEFTVESLHGTVVGEHFPLPVISDTNLYPGITQPRVLGDARFLHLKA